MQNRSAICYFSRRNNQVRTKPLDDGRNYWCLFATSLQPVFDQEIYPDYLEISSESFDVSSLF